MLMLAYRPFKSSIIIIQLLSLFACHSGNQKLSSELVPRPNIIWINAEDIGPALGFYGDTIAYTPKLDSLASHSLVFENAFAVAPICSPSRSTLATGLYPTSTGTQHLRSETPYPEELKTLPTIFSEAGYFTSLFGKTDYNFDPNGLWEHWENDKKPWRKANGRNFLSVFTLKSTHEGKANSLEKFQEERQLWEHVKVKENLKVAVPPYHPDNEVYQELWARYYQLITLFDHEVGEILENLKSDGLEEETIIFIFSDHGFGLPRHKRWLYDTGIKVPLLVYIPEKFKHLNPFGNNERVFDLVSFVDFVPTTIALAGLNVPDYMQGQQFLGEHTTPEKRTEIFASRSRADNVYEMSRAVRNDQFFYVRNYMPHLPYVQPSVIFSDEKDSYKNLIEMHHANRLNEYSNRFFESKPVEELYDILNDPYQLENLASDPKYQNQLVEMRKKLKQHVFEVKDLGYLYESELVTRSEGKPPYLLRDQMDKFDLERLYNAAEMVGMASLEDIRKLLRDSDTGVAFWGIMASRQLDRKEILLLKSELKMLLVSKSPTVKIAAAELLYELSPSVNLLLMIAQELKNPVNEVKLQAARALELLDPKDPKIIQMLSEELDYYKAKPGSKHPYIDYNFASFISWSLERIVGQ